MSVLTFKGVCKSYRDGDKTFLALDDVSISFEGGKFYVILGSSGSGKSTMLNLAGGIDRADGGKIIFDDSSDIVNYSDAELTQYRRRHVGFIFQFYNLIPSLTVLENVTVTSQFSRAKLDASDLLSRVCLADKARKYPAQLSGGELQRASIARALYKESSLLLCDEPTGALDAKTGCLVLQLLGDVAKEFEKTLILVTHNPAVALCADSVITLSDGQIATVQENAAPKSFYEVEL